MSRISESAITENKLHQTQSISPDLNVGMCKCLICGQTLSILLKHHAWGHSYSSKEALIADGKIKYLHQKRRDESN